MNEIRARLDSYLVLWRKDLSRALISELKEAFTRSNPDFYKKNRLGLWTGETPRKIKSWTLDDTFLILPRSSVVKVRKILSEHSRSLRVVDRTVVCSPVGLKLVDGNTLRPYQRRPVRSLIEAGSGIIRGRCGSGKTVVLIGAIAELDQPTIIVVHTRYLQDQWEGMISKWLGIVPGRIGGGTRRLRPVTVASQQTLWGMARRGETSWALSYGVLVADEIHHWAAKTFQVVAEMFPARYRIGASADEQRKDGKQFLIYETFGPVVDQIDPKELVADGQDVPTRMIVIPTEFYDEEFVRSVLEKKKGKSKPGWVRLINKISGDPGRNILILNLLIKLINNTDHNLTGKYPYQGREKNKFEQSTLFPWSGKNFPGESSGNIQVYSPGPVEAKILLLTERREAAKEWILRLRKIGIPSGLMIGGADYKDELHSTIQGLKDGILRVGVGTSVVFEGVDIPELTHVFITCPVHTHPKRLGQMIGRVSRKLPGKEEAICYYFWDRKIFPVPDPEENEFQRTAKERKFLRRLASLVEKMEVIEPFKLQG